MKRRMVSAMTLTLLLTSMAMLAFHVQPVRAEGAIYIRADGSIDPPTPLITTADNVTYTFTDNIYDEIVVERNNTVIDGNGYTLQGTGAYASKGINLSSRSNITSKNTNIKDFSYGILLSESSNISIIGNNITNNRWGGIGLWNSRYNSISRNHVTNNSGIGIQLTGLFGSSNNSIVGNVLVNDGLYVWSSYRNVVVDNSVNGKPLVYLEGASDVWVEDAGQVILVNCNRVEVENLNLSNTYIGVQLWRTANTTISGNTITNNGYGISLEDSSNYNSVVGNNITNNREYGIRLTLGIHSNYNSIVGNYITNNNYGIESGAENSISGNTITNNSIGIFLDSSYYSTIAGNHITNNSYGIQLSSSSSNSVVGNNITANNNQGIRLDDSSNNSVSGNNIRANHYEGIWVVDSFSNSISGNDIVDNMNGIYFYFTNNNVNNVFYHNNFINNTQQVHIENSGYANSWDDGYPFGGNYWSDYNGTDLYGGPYQNETGGDGIGDTLYDIDVNNRDSYPLMAPFNTFDAGTWNGTAYNFDVVSNSTVSNFQVDTFQKAISFNVTGVEETAGFCRVTIPNIIVQDLWQGNYTVLLNSEPWPFANWTDPTYTYIYINYTHSEHQVIIIPEFPSFLVLPLFMIASLLAVIVCRRKHTPKCFQIKILP